MKLEAKYSSIFECPKTGEQLMSNDIHYSNGVCPHCGHNAKGTLTHYNTIAGRWRKPNLLEWLMGKRAEFIPKSDEDKIMNSLKGK